MPLKVDTFEQGVLSIRESGHISGTDARSFAKIVKNYADTSPTPIVVFIDARRADVIMPDAAQVFIDNSLIRNVRGYIVATEGHVVTEASRILGMRNYRRNTVVMEDYIAARAYAYELAMGAAAG